MPGWSGMASRRGWKGVRYSRGGRCETENSGTGRMGSGRNQCALSQRVRSGYMLRPGEPAGTAWPIRGKNLGSGPGEMLAGNHCVEQLPQPFPVERKRDSMLQPALKGNQPHGVLSFLLLLF